MHNMYSADILVRDDEFLPSANEVLGQGTVLHLFVCSEGGLHMISFPIWLPGPMFHLGDLCLWSYVTSGEGECLCPGGLCPGESLFRGASVQGVYLQGVSVQGDFCRQRPPRYGEEWAVRILLECFPV